MLFFLQKSDRDGNIPRDTLFHGTDIRNLPLDRPFFRNSKGQSNVRKNSSIGLMSKSFIELTISICTKKPCTGLTLNFSTELTTIKPFYNLNNLKRMTA